MQSIDTFHGSSNLHSNRCLGEILEGISEARLHHDLEIINSMSCKAKGQQGFDASFSIQCVTYTIQPQSTRIAENSQYNNNSVHFITVTEVHSPTPKMPLVSRIKSLLQKIRFLNAFLHVLLHCHKALRSVRVI